MLLPGWNASDPEQVELMRLHLWGNGAAKTPTVEEDLQMFRDAGFEILESFDHMDVGDELYVAARPWCLCALVCGNTGCV